MTQQNHAYFRLTCLNGMKVLCMMWIILTHTFQFLLRYSMNRMLNFVEFVKDPFFGIVVGRFFLPDTFFLIGGLLVSYMGMMYMEASNGRLNIIGFYIRRIWRLLPSITFIIGITILIPLMGSGPLWNEVVTREGEICQRKWWATLLFISSWFDYFDMCLVHLWFVSDDMILYAFSPLFLIMFYKKPILGFIVSCVLIFASSLWSAVAVLIYELNVYLPLNMEQLLKYKDLLQLNHFMVISHVGPYLVGFLLGYLLYIKSEIKINRLTVLLGWAISTALALTALMSDNPWFNGSDPTVGEIAAHQSLHRIVWAASNAWVIFACCYGYGGWVNTILSWKLFIPFNRLVYMIYLTQMPVMWVRLGSKKHTVPIEHIETIYEFLGNTVIIVAVSTFSYLAVEAPFASLDYVIFGKLATKARRVSKVISNSLRLKDQSVNHQESTKNADKDFEKGPLPENYVHRRKRSEADVVGELTASMVTTVSPESEPCTDTEEQVRKMAELGLNPSMLKTLCVKNRRLSQILNNLNNEDTVTRVTDTSDSTEEEYTNNHSGKISKSSKEDLNGKLNTNNETSEKNDDKNVVELTNLKNLN